MNKMFLMGVASAALFVAQPSLAAVQVSVENIGSVFNESLALPAEDTPGNSIGFAEYFEFSLPVAETLTMSVSDSGFGSEKVVGGNFDLNTFTSTGPGPLFIPAGAFIDGAPLTNFVGGQEAVVGPNFLAAGNYFAEVSGTSGASPLHLVIDGTVTATSSVPEPSTWAMFVSGFGLLALLGLRKRTKNRLAAF
jgi:hypothetical protein